MPIVPLDVGAGSWPAAVGGERPLSVRVIVAASSEASLSTPQVAAAVDRGRDAAGAAAGEGVTVLVGRGVDADAAALVRWLRGDEDDPDIRGPLGALRRLGTSGLCELTGLALGAGEHGVGYVGDGLAAICAAAIAIAVEPDLRPRVRAADRTDAALLERIGIEPIVETGGLDAALRAIGAALD